MPQVALLNVDGLVITSKAILPKPTTTIAANKFIKIATP